MFRMFKNEEHLNSELMGNTSLFQVVHYSKVSEILRRFSNRKKVLITRNPSDCRDRFTLCIWVSKIEHPDAVSPSDLHIIEQKILELINESPIIVLDAFEYLMMEQGLETALKFAGKLRDIALLNNSGFIVTISEGLDDRTVALLKRIVEG